MTCRYRYLHDRHLLLENLSGEVDFAQLVAMKKEQVAKGVGGLGLRALVDLRDATIVFQRGQVKEFSDWMRRNAPDQLDTRSALLSSGPLETGLSLMYATDMKRAKTVEVFNTLRAALRWLDLQPEDIEDHRDIILEDANGH